MRTTGKQRSELVAIKYFVPSWVSFDEITDNDVERFFAWSDKGKPLGENVMSPPWTGIKALYWGKKYRDLHITTYLEDWGETLTAWDFREFPRDVAEYLSKRMGKPGIMSAYDEDLS